MLSVEALTKRYGDRVALREVSLSISRGEICGLLGANGAGKTTLLSIIVGLCRADVGSVSIDGIDTLAHPDRARDLIGFAPQETGVYPPLTVRENLVFFGELSDVRGRALSRRIDEVAEALDLQALLQRPARTLSGGERRRLHCAAALLHRPALLLLDEPTAGVDVDTRLRMLEAVRRLSVEDGTAVCYSTHYLHEVETLGASVAILDQGRIIARGDVRNLIARHGTSAIELVFDGPPPPLALDRRTEVEGSKLRIYTEHAGADLRLALELLGSAAERLRGVEVLTSNLESVFLVLTGRRFAEAETAGDALVEAS